MFQYMDHLQMMEIKQLKNVSNFNLHVIKILIYNKTQGHGCVGPWHKFDDVIYIPTMEFTNVLWVHLV
jgi:hypothetical protein